MPKSTHPDLADNLNNIILEDSEINRVRGAEVMTKDEI